MSVTLGSMHTSRRWIAAAASVLLGCGVTAAVAVPAQAATCTGVAVTTSSNIQSVINANPTGTTFCFAAGTYTGANDLIPKANDVLDGDGQLAVLNGGGTQSVAIQDGGSGNAGTDDGAAGVTVQNFTIENYNPSTYGAAVNARSGKNWIIQGNNISGNGEAGVATGDGVQVLNNTLDNNVREGFNAQGSTILYQGNTISGNNPNLVDNGDVEAGAGKLWQTTNATFKNNTVNNNCGPGLWADTNNIATTFDGNTVTNNWGPGIYEEISYDFHITNNDVENNGTATSCGGGENIGWLDDAGIELRDSQGNVSGNGVTGYGDSTISGNTVYDNYNAIALVEDGDPSPQTGCNNSGEGAYGACKIAYVDVQNNGVSMSSTTHLGTGAVNSGTDTSVYSGHNTFTGNNYCVNPSASYFQWNGASDSFATWQGLGFDTTGSYTVTSSKCLPPSASAPAVTTTAATGVSSSGATLNGTVNPEGQSTTYQFQWGTTTAYGSVTPASPGSAGSGTTAVNESAALTGLAASTIYHFRLTATNGTGTTNGADQQFTTSAAGGTSVAYDATGPSSSGAKVGGATLTWTHTVGSSGTNRALLVGASVGDNSPNDSSCTATAKDGTTTMTSLAKAHTDNQNHGYEQVWGLANPPTGANSITVTVTGCTPNEVTGGSESFTGVSQSTPFGTPVTAFGSGTTASATAASTSSDMMAGFVANGSSISSATSPSTSRFIANGNNNTAAGNSAGATSAATGSNVTMAWSVGSDWWAVAEIQVQHA